jgi:ADP-ribosylglycohydrolase
MIGAITGDMIGSVFEHSPIKSTTFPLFTEQSRFTDDTVLTVAVAYAIISHTAYDSALKSFGRRYPFAGYGSSFYRWLLVTESRPYNSWGNGSAMRISPVGFAFDAAEEVLHQAGQCAAVTHNHPEGIKGAQATALSVYLARTGKSKTQIRQQISGRFGYDLDRSLDDIRPDYSFDISCQGTVPEAIIAFLESENYVDAVRKGISLGGDSDTIGCITGGIAQAYYRQIPEEIVSQTRIRLPEEFLKVIDQFSQKFDCFLGEP